MFVEMLKLDQEYGLSVVGELKTKGDLANGDPLMNIGARILVNFSKGQIPN